METIQSRLNKIDYSFENYKPSLDSLMFIEFIKKVNEDSGGLENKTPLFHYKIADLLFDRYSKNKAIMCFRGASKTGLFEYMVLYGMCFNKMFGMKDVHVGMYIANSMKDGAKQFRNSLEQKIRNSAFLQEMIPTNKIKLSGNDNSIKFTLDENEELDRQIAQGMNFTDMALDVVNKNGQPFYLKLFGISTGVRGFKAYDKRPSFCICHAKGTEVFTDAGIHKVEHYYNKLPSRFEKGLEVKLCGLTRSEYVTKEHRYLISSMIKTTKKIYLKPIKHNQSAKGNTKSKSFREFSDHEWIEAQDIVVKQCLGNQKIRRDYFVKPIDYTVKEPKPFLYSKKKITKRNKEGHIIKHKVYLVEKLHKHVKHPSFWYLYGLYLSDGTAGKDRITFIFDNNKQEYIQCYLEHCKKLGYSTSCHMSKYSNCQTWTINDTALARFHKSNHLGNSIKFIPEWVLYQPVDLQKQLLLGYIAGDGYLDKKHNQIGINSVNEDAINKLGFICERIGLPYHIRMTRKKDMLQIINNEQYMSVSKKQWELKLSQNVKKHLGLDIDESTSTQVFIKNGYLYRRVKSITQMKDEMEFIPIKTPSHTYTTQFGLSHNCDDILKDADARSDAVIKGVEEVIYRAVPYALHPTQRVMCWAGTPFNSKDPLYKALESDSWKSVIFPVAEKFPCSKEEFKGAWEDRFPYEAVKEQYDIALQSGQEQGFRQEMMLQIIPEEGLLVTQDKIIEIATETFKEKNKNYYNFYITTDFAYSDRESSDYSVISVFAVNSNNEFILCDGVCVKQLIDANINLLFNFVQKYNPLQVGFELTGQQMGFVQILRNEMVKRNIFFNLKEIRPSKDKFSRFNLISPYFNQGRIFILSHMMKNAWGLEFKDEISKATIEGFKSKHDDVLDTFSQLMDLDIFAPSSFVGEQNIDIELYDNKKSLIF